MIEYLFGKVKKLLLSPRILKNVRKSKKAKICSGVEMNNVVIGDYSYVGHYTKINNCKIGKYSSISGNCLIGGGSHPTDWVSTSPLFHTKRSILGKGYNVLPYNPYKDTIIGNDVWIGSNVLIKAGIIINDGAVIGMGSVVTHDIPAYEIWAGNPARFIRKRFDDDTISSLLAIKWWDFDEERISKNSSLFCNPHSFLLNNENHEEITNNTEEQ